MCNELTTMDMEISPIVCGNVYINAPGGDEIIFHKELIKVVEDIGRRYGTVRGSALKKGIHYIFSETMCTSKRQIKMMMRNVPVACIHQADDVKYIFRCSRRHYIEVLATIIGFLPCDNQPTPNDLVPNAIEGLKMVRDTGTGITKKEAGDMLKKLKEIKKWG